MTSALDDQSLDQIFRSARTFNSWAGRPVEDDTVHEIYDLMKWGPTRTAAPRGLFGCIAPTERQRSSGLLRNRIRRKF
jgi:3-hydroxypropanoate dehydrogenase